MKKFFSLLAMCVAAIGGYAQGYNMMHYSAVVRDAQGDLVKSKTVSGIAAFGTELQPTAQADYLKKNSLAFQTFTATTDENGMMTVSLGSTEDNDLRNELAKAAMEKKEVQMCVAIDPDGGTNYTVVGFNTVLAVPYALTAGHARTAEKATSTTGLTTMGTSVKSSTARGINVKMKINGTEIGKDAATVNIPKYQTLILEGLRDTYYFGTGSYISMYLNGTEYEYQSGDAFRLFESVGKRTDSEGQWLVYKVGPFLEDVESLEFVMVNVTY